MIESGFILPFEQNPVKNGLENKIQVPFHISQDRIIWGRLYSCISCLGITDRLMARGEALNVAVHYARSSHTEALTPGFIGHAKVYSNVSGLSR